MPDGQIQRQFADTLNIYLVILADGVKRRAKRVNLLPNTELICASFMRIAYNSLNSKPDPHPEIGYAQAAKI